MVVVRVGAHPERKRVLPDDVLEDLVIHRDRFLLEQHCTFEYLEPGRYKICFVCVENTYSRDETEIPKQARSKYLGRILDLSRTLITFGLSDSEGKLAVFQKTADEHAADFVKDINGKYLLSDGSDIFLEGGNCGLIALGENGAVPDGLSLIAPRQTKARETFISDLGLLRYARLLPGVNYKIERVLYSEGVNHLSHVKRRFVELGVSEALAGDGAEERLEDHGQIAIRAYLRKGDEPLKDRITGFLSMRKGIIFRPSQAIPTMMMAAEMDKALEQFGAAGKEPLLRRGEVYLLDGVHANAPWKAHVFYRPLSFGKCVGEPGTIPAAKHALVIRAYPNSAHWQGKDPMPNFMACRTIDNVIGYFNPIVFDDTKEKVVFTVMRDVYAGMLDFMLWHSAESDNILSMGHIDISDPDAIVKFAYKAQRRHKYNTISIRRYEQNGAPMKS